MGPFSHNCSKCGSKCVGASDGLMEGGGCPACHKRKHDVRLQNEQQNKMRKMEKRIAELEKKLEEKS